MTREASHFTEEDADLDALQRVDPRLVALALGRIDDDELEELLARAEREPEIQRAVEAFWPLDEGARQLSFLRARDVLATQTEKPCRPHWSLLFLPSGVAASVIGLAAVLVMEAVQPLPLPGYRLEVRGGLRTMRSARTDVVVGRFAPQAPVDLVFRPEEPIDGPAQAAVFLVGPQDLIRLDSRPEVSDSGSVRWRGTIQSLLPGEAGAVELIMAVRAGDRAPSATEVRRALQAPTPTLRVAKTTLFIEGP